MGYGPFSTEERMGHTESREFWLARDSSGQAVRIVCGPSLHRAPESADDAGDDLPTGIEHPNLWPVLATGWDDEAGRPWFAEPHRDGPRLSEILQLLATGDASEIDAPSRRIASAAIVHEISAGLEHAATFDIGHGSLTSDDVYLNLDGRVCVGGYGLGWHSDGGSAAQQRDEASLARLARLLGLQPRRSDSLDAGWAEVLDRSRSAAAWKTAMGEELDRLGVAQTKEALSRIFEKLDVFYALDESDDAAPGTDRTDEAKRADRRGSPASPASVVSIPKEATPLGQPIPQSLLSDAAAEIQKTAPPPAQNPGDSRDAELRAILSGSGAATREPSPWVGRIVFLVAAGLGLAAFAWWNEPSSVSTAEAPPPDANDDQLRALPPLDAPPDKPKTLTEAERERLAGIRRAIAAGKLEQAEADLGRPRADEADEEIEVRALLYRAAERDLDAAAQWMRLAKRQPKVLEWVLNASEHYQRAQAYQAAADDLMWARTVHAESAELELALGQTWEGLGNARRSYESYARALELKPRDLGAAWGAIRTAWRGRQLEKVGKLVSEVDERHGLKDADLLLGEVAFRRRRFAEADKHFAAHEAAFPADWRAVFGRANASARRNDLETATAHFDRASLIAPKVAEIHHNIGLLYRDHGDTDSAQAAFRRALAVDADCWQSDCELAKLLQRGGAFEEAATRFQSLGKRMPTHPWLAQAASTEIDSAFADYLTTRGCAVPENFGLTGKE